MRFEHPDLKVIVQSPLVERVLELATVQPFNVGVLFIDGDFIETLPPGRYACWKNVAQVKLVQEDLREAMFDVAGQDILRSGIAATALRSAHARVPCSVAGDAADERGRHVSRHR